MPALRTPRSARRIFCAERALNLRTASSSVKSFSSRTYLRRIRGKVPKARGCGCSLPSTPSRAAALRIVADRDPRLAQGEGDVGLAHGKHADHGEGFIFDEDVEDGVD